MLALFTRCKSNFACPPVEWKSFWKWAWRLEMFPEFLCHLFSMEHLFTSLSLPQSVHPLLLLLWMNRLSVVLPMRIECPWTDVAVDPLVKGVPLIYCITLSFYFLSLLQYLMLSIRFGLTLERLPLSSREPEAWNWISCGMCSVYSIFDFHFFNWQSGLYYNRLR